MEQSHITENFESTVKFLPIEKQHPMEHTLQSENQPIEIDGILNHVVRNTSLPAKLDPTQGTRKFPKTLPQMGPGLINTL